MLTAKTILIVEDEENLGLTLQEYLEDKGFNSLLAQTKEQAWTLFLNHSPQVVLMDIGLPDGSGLDLARQMRKDRNDFLLLFLSALNDPDTKLEGLEIGAEDYITKPFALKELLFRLEKSFQLRDDLWQAQSKSSDPDGSLSYGPLKIFFPRFQVQDAFGKIIDLGQKECAILKFFHERPGVVLSREEIISHIWGEDKYPSNRTVDNYIVSLRKWSETDKNKNLEIQSIRGIGYKLIIKSE